MGKVQAVKTYTPYQERIRECFAQAFRFFEKYQCPRTDEDWKKIVENLSPYKDPFTVDLIVAAVSELEREYKEHEKGHISATN